MMNNQSNQLLNSYRNTPQPIGYSATAQTGKQIVGQY
jgi:hypothetical protein